MSLLTVGTQIGTEFTGKIKTITEERVYSFSGGFPRGPEWPKKTIHTNIDVASRCGLKKRMASGAMFEGYLIELMIDLFGERWLSKGKMTLKFIAQVSPGDTLVAKAIIESKETANSTTKYKLNLWCENQNAQKVVIGSATGWI